MSILPTTNTEQIAQFQAEYQSAFNGGNQEELENAKCRLIWALVHGDTKTNVQRGLDLALAALESDKLSADQDRELKYFVSVAYYNLGRYIDARRAIGGLLQAYPDFRQGESLKQDVDDRVMKEGLIGLGVLGAVAAVGIGLLVGATKRR